MKFRATLAAVAVVAASVTIPMAAWGETVDNGALWADTSEGNATSVADDCGSGGGPRSVDDSYFCVIDDDGAVELGVKFITARPVLITGVRVYRVDGGSVTGSLWSDDGVRLATGTFASQSSHGWQDLHFAHPVPILPGHEYVASYLAPNADYAFEWNFFTDQFTTLGPITALQSVGDDSNGVYCYVGQACDPFPIYSYNDTNYWVSPIWGSYNFSGFFQPVDTDKMNLAKAGSAIPVKFTLGGDMGMGIVKEGFPKATQISCDVSAQMDSIEATVTAGKSSLAYDPVADQYIYVWKTRKAWANTCYQFDLGLNDGSDHSFEVKFRR